MSQQPDFGPVGTRDVHVADAGLLSADMKHLSKGLHSGVAKKLGRNPNAARDLGRRLLKRCPWPELYWCEIPVLDVKLQQETTSLLPMLLPHELIHTMLKRADKQDLLRRGGLSQMSLAHLLKLEEVFDTRGSLAVGLWLDGTPYSYAPWSCCSKQRPEIANHCHPKALLHQANNI